METRAQVVSFSPIAPAAKARGIAPAAGAPRSGFGGADRSQASITSVSAWAIKARPALPGPARPAGGPSRTAVGAFCLAICLTIALLGALGAELALAYRAPVEHVNQSETANAALIAGYYTDVWNRERSLSLPYYVSADHLYHDPSLTNAAVGPVGISLVVSGLRRAFPDLVLTLEEVVVTGDRAVVRFTMRGTHRGALLGAEGTGRAVETTGVAVHHIAGGLIVETWVVWDTLRLAVQLGLAVVPVSILAQDDRREGAPSDARLGRPH